MIKMLRQCQTAKYLALATNVLNSALSLLLKDNEVKVR